MCAQLWGGARIKNKSHIISARAISGLAGVWVQSNKPQKKKKCLCIAARVRTGMC